MTPDWLPAGHVLSAWHGHFPNRHNLWAGTFRLWRIELAVQPPTPDSILSEWIAKAAVAGVPHRLGLPTSVVAALGATAAGVPTRESFAFLELPAGPHRVALPPARFEPWPDSTASVPAAVLHPAAVAVVPPSDDWRTIPVVRSEAVAVIAVRIDDRIEVYLAGEPGPQPLWELPQDALPAAGLEEWTAAWRTWAARNGDAKGDVVGLANGVIRVSSPVPTATWLWAGNGPLREAVLVDGAG